MIPQRVAAVSFVLALLPSWHVGLAESITVERLERATFRRVPGKSDDGACLTTGKRGSWNDLYVGTPTVVYDGETYWMWYCGGQKTDDSSYPYNLVEQIGGATSPDGITWFALNDGKPALSPGPEGSPDARGLAHPFVLRIKNRFLMWYGAIDGRHASDLKMSPAHVRVEQICLASSRDAVHWQRENGGRPVMSLGARGTVDSIQVTGMHIVRMPDGVLRMWYGAYNGDHRIAVAESKDDGLSWERLFDGRPITNLRGGKQGQLGPSVYFDGKSYFMLYGADVGNEWKTYAAASDDGFHFRQLNGGRPILGAPGKDAFDTGGIGANHSVHVTKLITGKNRVRSWYTGQHGKYQSIGLMEALLSR